MSQIELCAECGFDSRAYTYDDVLGTLRTVPPWWGLLTEHVDDARLHRRPAPGTWSAIEYGEHMVDVFRLHTFGLAWMLREDRPVFPSVDAQPVRPEPSATPLAEVTSALAGAVREYLRVAKEVRGEMRHRTATLGDGLDIEASWLVRHSVHDALHHLHDIGRNLVGLGVSAPRQEGVVEQVSASGGGVPKQAVPSAEVGPRGVEGDHQRTRRHHGRQWQALCLMTAEGIERMRAEGHPIAFGSAGENFTIRGVDWAALRPGNRLRIGDVLCELSVPALPCANNAQWFTDHDFMRMHHERHRDDTRWYASVVECGAVRAGDAVVLEP